MSQESLIVFDVETTGTDTQKDQVIELCVQFGIGEEATSKVWRIKPRVAINPGAQEVHGISMEDLADEPHFEELAEEIYQTLENAQVWVGYNIVFDIQMLQSEFKRLKLGFPDENSKHIVDPFRLWQQCEPRTLQMAHKRFAGGKEFESAHSAKADVAATGRVLMGMREYFELPNDWQDVASICEPNRKRWIGPSNHLQWNDKGKATIAFGKHSGKTIDDVVSQGNSGYLKWILQKDFPQHVHQVCKQALNLEQSEFGAWLAEEFNVPSPPQ